MSSVRDIAERLRGEPFHIFSLRHNCIGRSFRFKAAVVEWASMQGR